METGAVKWFWLRDEHNNPVACVATKLGTEGIAFAVAIPNPKDRFDRTRGREIAVGRLEHGKPKMCTLETGVHPKQQVYALIAKDTNLSQRIRKAAQFRLQETQRIMTLTESLVA